MTPAQFDAWRLDLRLTQKEAAEELGCSRESMRVWLKGIRPIPKYIALACQTIECFGTGVNSTLRMKGTRK